MGLLPHVTKDPVSRKRSYPYVVPNLLKPLVLKDAHDEARHHGQQRTLWLIRQRFFGQGLEADVKEYMKCC